jgi:hypothetical protein
VYFTDNLGYNGYMNSTMDFSASYPYTLTTTVPTFSRDQVNYETKWSNSNTIEKLCKH